MNKVSIIIPFYNSARLLEKTVQAALIQTYTDKEIILVDDGSSDDGYTIAKSFESNSIKVVGQKNEGAAVARNTGLDHASGDYIQFLDAGDFLSPDKIEWQV